MIFLFLTAFAVAPEDLAPDLNTVEKHLDRSELLLDTSDTVGAELARAQNGWTEGVYKTHERVCGAKASALREKARIAGAKQRAHLQSARVEVERLRLIMDALTVAPILDDVHRSRAAVIQERLRVAVLAWKTSAAYQKAVMDWRSRWCKQ